MARRTIRAQRASPYMLYLVIAFSLLMVGGWVAFGWMYSLKNRGEVIVFGEAALNDPNANLDDMWNKLSVQYKEDGSNLRDVLKKKEDIANNYQGDIRSVSGALVGNDFTGETADQLRTDAASAVVAANQVIQEALATQYLPGGLPPSSGRVPNMIAAIHGLMQRIDSMGTQVKNDAAAAADLKNKIDGLQKEVATITDQNKLTVTQLKASAADEAARLTADRDSAVKLTVQLKEDIQRATDTFLAKQGAFAKERDTLSQNITKLQNDLKALAAEIKKFRQVPTAMAINGKIVAMAPQGQVAYGNLGKKDGVLLGLPFSIFSPTELGKAKPEPKAQCRIVKIMNDSCELRIYEIKSDNPVIAGNLLYNPVYDRTRRLHFALIGKMDIDNSNQDSTEQLKGLIQEFGGKIDPNLTVQTDFLVVGDEPVVGAVPAAGAPPMEAAAYAESRRRFLEYRDAIARAENFSIPTLSLNRFVGLMGLAERK